MTLRHILILFNPKSTGNSQKNAEDFYERLKKAGPDLKIHLQATKHAGHARELAEQFANSHMDAMIISSSGDGGYNEVVNGVLHSKNPRAVTGVLPSGNANDHYHFMHKGKTIERIISSDIEEIDVLKLSHGKQVHYAHSYIGLGLTPQIGEVLTANDLNIFKEAWLVATHLFKVRPVKILVDGQTKRYDHLVFLNIARMSKYLKVADHGTTHDGEFEVVAVKSGSFKELLKHLFTAAAKGVRAREQTSQYNFQTLRPLKIQLDGEVISLKSGVKTRIESQQKALRSIV